MYQSVDDINDAEESVIPPKKALNRLKVSVLILFGIVLLILAAIYSAQTQRSNNAPPDQTAEHYAVYTKAMTETDPALRRARLLDFIQTYPKHGRLLAAKAQLSVIQATEAKDWASLTDVVYNPIQSEPVKLAALDLYEDIWGTQLLGGREHDLIRLKALLGEEVILKQEDGEELDETKDFTPPPDKFDDSVNGDEMAGGVFIPEPTYIPPTPPVETLPNNNGLVIEPKVRKNVKARYPSRALRRGIDAEITLALNIDEKGHVQMTELISVKTRKYHKHFVKAAERAALKTRFYPKTIDGRPVASMGVTKRFVFQVED